MLHSEGRELPLFQQKNFKNHMHALQLHDANRTNQMNSSTSPMILCITLKILKKLSIAFHQFLLLLFQCLTWLFQPCLWALFAHFSIHSLSFLFISRSIVLPQFLPDYLFAILDEYVCRTLLSHIFLLNNLDRCSFCIYNFSLNPCFHDSLCMLIPDGICPSDIKGMDFSFG